ncbi:MAG: hypothetical protein Q8941_17025 [Bacteroidota bacterium]|nr:hypothetical protein [Bacteroidota bacterium]
MEKKYFIQQYLQEEYLHGGITCVDAEKVFLAKGFEPVLFPYQQDFSLRAKIGRIIFLLRTFLKIKNGSVLVFIFPVYARINKLLLNLLMKKKGVKIICYIADINGIKDGDGAVLKKEISFFRKFNFFIVHNEKMKEWLYTNVSPHCLAEAVEFFDFFTQPVLRERHLSPDIVFAGNLGKSTFLENLHRLTGKDTGLRFHLYGPWPTDAMLSQKNVTYYGVEKPYELPAKVNGSFGLLWDGDSIDKPGGSLGHYMQFITHHKLSLYIMSQLPIIEPATAGSAPLIEKYKIGFTINSPDEIGEKIKNLSENEYRQMQVNMRPLAEKLSKGECLGDAIDKLMKII